MHDTYIPGTTLFCTQGRPWQVIRYVLGRGYVLEGLTGRILVPKKSAHSRMWKVI